MGKKVFLVLFLLIVSVYIIPLALADPRGINIPEVIAQAGPAGSATINGTFLVKNMESYNDGRFNVALTGITVHTIDDGKSGGASMVGGSDIIAPSGSTSDPIIIGPNGEQNFNYVIGVQGVGWVMTEVSLWGFYDQNHSLGMNATDGFYVKTSDVYSDQIIVTSTLPEFSLNILPLLLSMLLFGIIRRRLE